MAKRDPKPARELTPQQREAQEKLRRLYLLSSSKLIDKAGESLLSRTATWHHGRQLKGEAADLFRQLDEALRDKDPETQRRIREQFSEMRKEVTGQAVPFVGRGAGPDGSQPIGRLPEEGSGDYVEQAREIYEYYDIVRGVHDEWRDAQRELSDDERRFSRSLVTAASRSGDLAHLDQIERALSNIPGATRREGLAAFSAISQQAPRVRLGDRLALSAGAAALAPVAHPAQLGRMAGALAKLGGDTSENDLLDLAVAARESLGPKAGRLTRRLSVETLETLSKQGYTQEAALALVGGTIREGASVYNLNRAAMGGARLDRLIEISGGNRRTFAAAVAYYERAQGQDLASRRLQEIGQSQAGRDLLRQRLSAATIDRSLAAEREYASQVQMGDDVLEARYRRDNASWSRRVIGQHAYGALHLGRDYASDLGVPLPSEASLAAGSYLFSQFPGVGLIGLAMGAANFGTRARAKATVERTADVYRQVGKGDRIEDVVGELKEQVRLLRGLGQRPVALGVHAE